MTQADPTVAANASGTTLRTTHNDAIDATNTTHKGSSRPSYAEAGMVWVDDSGGATATLVKYYDGTDDITLGTLNTTTNVFKPANVQLIDGSTIYAADAGSNDTYAITLSPVPTAYTTGMVIQFKANTANTGAATLNVNSLGAKTIKKNVSDDLEDNDIKANQISTVVYDGTNFQLLSHTNEAALVATQAEQEAGSSTTKRVTPGRQQYHPSAAKAWVNFNGTGTVAINASYNVSSITDNGTGDYTVNLTTAFSSANYAAAAVARHPSANRSIVSITSGTAPTSSAFRVICVDENVPAAADMSIVSIIFFGDQ